MAARVSFGGIGRSRVATGSGRGGSGLCGAGSGVRPGVGGSGWGAVRRWWVGGQQAVGDDGLRVVEHGGWVAVVPGEGVRQAGQVGAAAEQEVPGQVPDGDVRLGDRLCGGGKDALHDRLGQGVQVWGIDQERGVRRGEDQRRGVAGGEGLFHLVQLRGHGEAVAVILGGVRGS